MALPLILPRRENDHTYAIICSMTERAIKPKQPVKRKKKAIKAAKVDTPQPNSAAEAAIFVGSLGMALYAIFVFVMSVVAVAFNDTGAKGVELISFAIFLFGVNIVAQSILVSKEIRRVDRYGQRIIAVFMTIAPLVLFILSIITTMLYRYDSDCIHGYSSSSPCVFAYETSMLTMMMSKLSPIISVVGSVYLWFLLKRKDKLFWIYDEASKNKVANEEIIERSKSFRRIGIALMVITVVLYIIRILGFMPRGFISPDQGWLQFAILSSIDYFFTSMIWVLFIIAGIIFFIKSK